MPYREERVDITAENQWTTAFVVKSPGLVIIEDTGSISATISLQLSRDNGATWLTVKEYTEGVVEFLQHGSRQLYRLGVATGDFSSGTASCVLVDSGDHNR